MNRLVLPDVRFYPLEPNEFCRLPGNARNIRLPLGPLGAVDTREARVVAEMFLDLTRYCGLWTAILEDALTTRVMSSRGVQGVLVGIEQLVEHGYLVKRQLVDAPQDNNIYCFPTVILAQTAMNVRVGS